MVKKRAIDSHRALLLMRSRFHVKREQESYRFSLRFDDNDDDDEQTTHFFYCVGITHRSANWQTISRELKHKQQKRLRM